MGLKFLARLATTMAAGALVAATVLGRSGSTAWPLELLSNLVVPLGLLSLACVVAATALRARVALLLGLVALTVNAVATWSVVGNEVPASFAAPPNGPTLVIGHLNAQSGSIDLRALRSMLRESRPDVFVVLEPSQDDTHSLRRDSAGYAVATTATLASPPWVRTVVLSRVPLQSVRHPEGQNIPPATVEYVATLDRRPVSIYVLHTESPGTPSRAANRNRALAVAARWARQHGTLSVIEGDFNATPWSPVFRSTERDGNVHSSLVGFGQQSTWPGSWGWAGLPIDHALLGSGLVTVDRATIDDTGSQHRALLVRIGLRSNR